MKFVCAVVGACVLYGAVALVTWSYVHFALLPNVHAARAELTRVEPKIIADLRLLTEKPIYPERPRAKNAEHFLSGFVSWSGPGCRPLVTVEHDRLIRLQRAHEQALQSQQDWSALVNDELLSSMDLEWVDQLTAYDHIDFSTHPQEVEMLGRVSRTSGVGRIGIATTLPIPELGELRFATLARVAQLSLKERAKEGPSIYRHISYLMLSTDSLIGAMSAAKMLENEKSLGRYLSTDLEAVDESRIAALKRTSWAWTGIEQLRASSPTIGAFEPFLNRASNACAGVYETLGMTDTLQDYLAPTWPLEYDLSQRLTRSRAFKQRLFELCDHENLKVFLEPVQVEDLTRRLRPNFARIPFLRRVWGLQILAASTPNYFRLYDDTTRDPASNR